MKKGLLLLLVLILIAAVFIGCNKNEDIVEPSNIEDLPEDAPDIEDVPSIEDIPADEAAVITTEEETPFVMVQEDGSQVYLDEESPNVIKLQMAVAKYGELEENIDYRTVDGKEIYPILTEEGQKGYEEADMPDKAIDFYNKYKIVQSFAGIEKYDSVVFEGDTAIVDVDVAFVYEEVENLADYEIGTTYYIPKTLEFKIVDGEWLLNMDLDTGQIYHVADED